MPTPTRLNDVFYHESARRTVETPRLNGGMTRWTISRRAPDRALERTATVTESLDSWAKHHYSGVPSIWFRGRYVQNPKEQCKIPRYIRTVAIDYPVELRFLTAS